MNIRLWKSSRLVAGVAISHFLSGRSGEMLIEKWKKIFFSFAGVSLHG